MKVRIKIDTTQNTQNNSLFITGKYNSKNQLQVSYRNLCFGVITLLVITGLYRNPTLSVKDCFNVKTSFSTLWASFDLHIVGYL